MGIRRKEMSKKLLAIFLLLGVLTYAEDNDTTVIINDNAQKAIDNGEVITTEVTKKVVGENNQQLDVKEIDTEELILQNQNLESSSINITGENLNQQIIQAIKNAVAKASNPTYTIKYINTSKDKIDSEALQDIEDAKLGAKLYSEYLASGSKSTSWADIKKENGL